MNDEPPPTGAPDIASPSYRIRRLRRALIWVWCACAVLSGIWFVLLDIGGEMGGIGVDMHSELVDWLWFVGGVALVLLIIFFPLAWLESITARNLASALSKKAKPAEMGRVEQCKTRLGDHGYGVKESGATWIVRDPLGGRESLNSIEELEEYARSKGV